MTRIAPLIAAAALVVPMAACSSSSSSDDGGTAAGGPVTITFANADPAAIWKPSWTTARHSIRTSRSSS